MLGKDSVDSARAPRHDLLTDLATKIGDFARQKLVDGTLLSTSKSSVISVYSARGRSRGCDKQGAGRSHIAGWTKALEHFAQRQHVGTGRSNCNWTAVAAAAIKVAMDI